MHLSNAFIAGRLLISEGFPHLCSEKYMDFIGAVEMKWKIAFRVFCNKKVPPKFKGRVRVTMLYGAGVLAN